MTYNIASSMVAASARGPAEGVDARSINWTIIIRAALDPDERSCWFAGTASRADVAAGADAEHGAYGQTRQDLASRGFGTRSDGGARVLAAMVDTGELEWTLAIVAALGFRLRLAVDVGVSKG